MNMYLNLEYTKQHPKTWFSRHEFGERTPIAYTWQDKSWLPFGEVRDTTCILKPLQLSKQSSPKAWGHFGDAAWCCSIAARSPIPKCVQWHRSQSLLCFCKMVRAEVAVSNTYALHLTSATVFKKKKKTHKNLACFRNIVYPLSVLQYALKMFRDK